MVGQSATATGGNFPPNTAGNVCLVTQSPGVCQPNQLFPLSSDAAGNFSSPFTVPNFPGTQNIDVTIGGLNAAFAYTINPAVTTPPTNGTTVIPPFVPSGPTLSVSPSPVEHNQKYRLFGTGYSPGATYTLRIDTYGDTATINVGGVPVRPPSIDTRTVQVTANLRGEIEYDGTAPHHPYHEVGFFVPEVSKGTTLKVVDPQPQVQILGPGQTITPGYFFIPGVGGTGAGIPPDFHLGPYHPGTYLIPQGVVSQNVVINPQLWGTGGPGITSSNNGGFNQNPSGNVPGSSFYGDYNNDGIVDAQDYNAWRANFGSFQ
jgi:hypothetical protein